MKKYPLFKVHVGDSALEKISSVFDSGTINEGVEVTKLTNELRAFLRADNLVLVNSGTSALTLALVLAGVGPGDEVISTPMTCVATNTPIVNLGPDIVWADIGNNSVTRLQGHPVGPHRPDERGAINFNMYICIALRSQDYGTMWIGVVVCYYLTLQCNNGIPVIGKIAMVSKHKLASKKCDDKR